MPEPEVFSREDMEKIIVKRLRESETEKWARGINGSIAALTTQVTSLNERFEVWSKSVLTVETLDSADFWVRFGVPAGLSPEEREALKIVADGRIVADQLYKARERWFQNFWGRVAAASGAVLALAEIINLTVNFSLRFHWRWPF